MIPLREAFPSVVAGAAEDEARRQLARCTRAVFDHEADAVSVGVNEMALLCVAVLSVGASSRPANVDLNDPHKGKSWDYCRDCDGCGWSEGGSTLRTGCGPCGGSGVIYREES